MTQLAQNITYPHITCDPAVRGGHPVVEGTRIPVSTLVRCHQLGTSFDEILAEYPTLTPVGLHAAFTFYFDHKPEIDSLIEAGKKPPAASMVVEV